MAGDDSRVRDGATREAARAEASRLMRRAAIRRRILQSLAGVALLATVGLIAVLSANEGADLPSLSDIAGPVTVDGPAVTLPLPPAGQADPAAGSPSPRITALDLDGNTVTVGEGGRAQVLVMLAHWCPVCEQELPSLRETVTAGNVPQDVDVILVMTGLDPTRPNWPPDRWLSDAGLGGVTTIRDDASDTIMNAYALRAYPAWAVIGPDGTILFRHQGLLSTEGITQLLSFVSSTR